MSTPQILKLSKGVSKIVLKFPHEFIFRKRKFWNSFTSLPFFRNGLLEILVDLVSRRKSRRPCSIKFLSTSQVEAGKVEIFLSSQGS
jgi:hypothetical protein